MKLKEKLKQLLSFSNYTNKNTESSPTIKQEENPDNWLMDGYSWIPNWKEILENDWENWLDLAKSKKTGPKVLISTSVGGNSALTPVESLLGVALTLRGADVHYLICDKTLPACQNCYAANQEKQQAFLDNGPDQCDWCFETGMKCLEQLGLPIHFFGNLVTQEDWDKAEKLASHTSVDEILEWKQDGVDVGETVESAVYRFLGKSTFEDEPLLEPIIKTHFKSSLISTWSLQKLYKDNKFDHTVSNQGVYVPQANVIYVAKQFNSHVVSWDLAYRELCTIFTHGDTFIRTSLDEPTELWEEMSWNDSNKEEILDYMNSRWSGEQDWLATITNSHVGEPNTIATELGIDPSKPCIGLLTNVIWDAQLAYPSNAFEDQVDWLIKTIEYFKNRQDLQLIIRIHPAEVKSWLQSRQSVVNEIKKHFGTPPPNVFVVAPEQKINTYKAMQLCNAVLIYGTTAGLEMACMKIPVVVAGQAWIRNKGIACDVSNPDDYWELLDKLPFKDKLSDSKWERALKYAYHFYLRRMIPINVVEATSYENAPCKIKRQSLKSLSEGQDLGLDIVCKGILNEQSEFIYPAEIQSKTTISSK